MIAAEKLDELMRQVVYEIPREALHNKVYEISM